MKIAIIHDSFTSFGGAERVLFSLIRIFKQADIYTSLISENFVQEIKKKSKGELSFSKLSNFKIAKLYPSFFKPYFFHYYWQSLNLDQYDLVISSSHSFCANWVKVKHKHISYIYTPPRFLYGQYNEMSWLRNPIIEKLLKPYWQYLKNKDYQNIQKINILIADSINVKKRINKSYQRKAIVIYPPVKLAEKIVNKKTNVKKSYLFFSRLVKQKGIELVIKTFNFNQKPLLVAGTSSQEKKWRKMANKNIKFLGFISDAQKAKIYQESLALVYASIEEDFGMVPVEALSHGVPVIAYQSGGVSESIVDQKTGLFFRIYNLESLNAAIEKFEKMTFKKKDCINQAKKFSEEIFTEKILQLIKK